MQRKDFLRTMAIFPFLGSSIKLSQFEQLSGNMELTDPLPVVFAGHGSPMNAIEKNVFSKQWAAIGSSMPRPAGILCISAHWETKGSFVTAMERPKTIHDFGGFPKALYEVEYPAPGDPRLASETATLLSDSNAGLNLDWGLDHGTWSILTHMFPKANIPVIQLSLDYTRPPAYHYQLARRLSSLRKKGILILGSGNMVHNLGMLDWQNQDSGSDWALEANALFKKLIQENRHQELQEYRKLGKAVELAVPSPEHYLPMLYILGLQEEKESPTFFNDQAVMGSLTMTSLIIQS